jgi:hypothetical protein
MAILPNTFADAVQLTRGLGLKYLWIDSLCIIQDDPDDWARESARMADVYHHAALTISADGASDSSKGLFQTIENPRTKEISIPFQCPTGAGSICARKSDLHGKDRVHVIGQKKEEPLRSRGWVLQEWILSNRIVHFTAGEILWECNMFHCCECQIASQSNLEDHKHWQAINETSKTHFYQRGEAKSDERFNWPRVVENFSDRQLTKNTDRLPALSGLATLHKPKASEDYAAGIWKSQLPQALLWRIHPGNTPYSSDRGTRHEVYYAPSWSWASITTGRIMCQSHETTGWDVVCKAKPVQCEFLEVYTLPATQNPFGPTSSAFIKMRGEIGIVERNTEWDNNTEGRFIGITRHALHGIEYTVDIWPDVGRSPMDWELNPTDDIFLLLLEKRTWIPKDYWRDPDFSHNHPSSLLGIAMKRLEKFDEFKRVGFAEIKYKSYYESEVISDLKLETRVITIV